MIDATAFGPNHVQIFQTHGLGATAMLVPWNDVHALIRALQAIVRERHEIEALIPDD